MIDPVNILVNVQLKSVFDLGRYRRHASGCFWQPKDYVHDVVQARSRHLDLIGHRADLLRLTIFVDGLAGNLRLKQSPHHWLQLFERNLTLDYLSLVWA
ncbi:hypothetical protein D3C75_1030190 [compost metagenome]